MAEEILINVNVDGERELTNVVKGVEDLGKKANKTQSELQKLRNELKQQKAAMLSAEEGTEEYGRALARASEIQQRMTDVNKQVRAGMRGVGEMATQTASIVSGMGGGFSALTGVMNLFGVENEEVLKSIQRLQAVMAITSGLATFVDSIDAMQEFMSSLRASTAMAAGEIDNMKKPVTELSVVAGEAGDNLGNMGKEAAVLGSNMSSVQSITDNTKDSFQSISKTLTDFKKSTLDNDIAILKLNGDVDKLSSTTRNYLLTLDDGTGVKVEAAIEALEEYRDSLDTSSKSTEKLNDVTKKTGSTLLKTIGTMVLLTAAITAVFFVIEKLIEYLNKIPDEVKLKFELEESIVKDTQKAMEEVAQIRQNITITSNKKELDLLKEKLVAEGIATKEQLKGLNDSKSLLNAAFWDEYIENVKSVAENEYLIRRDIELRLQKELNETKYRQIANEETFLQSVFGGAVKTARKEFEAAYKEYETFQKTFYNPNGTLKLKPVKFDIGSGGKSTTGTKIDETELKPDTFLNLGTPTKEQIKNSEKNIESYLKNIFKKANDFIKKSIGKDPDLAEAANTLTTIFEGEIVNVNTPTSTENLQKRFDTIDGRRQKFVEDERNAFEQQMELYQSYATSLGGITDGIAGIYDARMQVIDNYYNAEAALIENSLLTEEEKNNRLAKLDAERYEKQKKLLEQQKAFRIATVAMDLASGLMGIYTRAALPVAAGGLPRPANWIAAGLEAASLTAQSVASIAQIRAQQIQAPSTSTSGASGVSIGALNPTKTALTTKEENLNMMQKAGENSQSVVRVSEINDVQNRVSVREKNSQF